MLQKQENNSTLQGGDYAKISTSKRWKITNYFGRKKQGNANKWSPAVIKQEVGEKNMKIEDKKLQIQRTTQRLHAK